jgi:uncharacterized protein YbaP (TraB family)
MMRFLAAALLVLIGAPQAAHAEAAAPARPALWSVSDPDTTIYLFGTFHLLPPGVDWYGGPVARAFERAGTLRSEIASLEAETPAIQALVLSRGMAPDRPLLARFSGEDRLVIEAAITASGLPAEAFQTMQPWLASLTLATTMLGALGLDPAEGVDKALQERAAAAGKAKEGFETGAEQIGFFADLADPVQEAMLVSTARDMAQARDEMPAMVEAWTRGDADRLGALMNDSLADHPELGKVLLADRNARWAAWIAARLNQPGVVFVAVGAGHLAGPDSVQAMLEARGLHVRRLQ